MQRKTYRVYTTSNFAHDGEFIGVLRLTNAEFNAAFAGGIFSLELIPDELPCCMAAARVAKFRADANAENEARAAAAE